MGWKEQIADGLGVIIIAAWLILVYFLLINRGESELLWSRSMFVFGSVEAIALRLQAITLAKKCIARELIKQKPGIRNMKPMQISSKQMDGNC